MPTLREARILHKQGIQLYYMMVFMIPSSNLQFQYFWDFNICIQAIFSQLIFQNFWLYLSGNVVITQNYYKSPPIVSELTV